MAIFTAPVKCRGRVALKNLRQGDVSEERRWPGSAISTEAGEDETRPGWQPSDPAWRGSRPRLKTNGAESRRVAAPPGAAFPRPAH